ncbi:MAG: hypothetical protein QOF76_4954 [Solirubrobacteraceae bacterium]|nr:hypothetical protein [Solirubrobacteraceae bacterium]
MPVVVVVVDRAGIVLEVSDHAAAVSQNPRATIVGEPITKFAAAAGATLEELTTIRSSIADGTAGSYTARRVLSGGEEMSLSVVIVPNAGPDGTVTTLTMFAASSAIVSGDRDARSQLLMDASRLLVGNLDLDRTLASVVDLLVPEWTDACALLLLDERGAHRLAAFRHADPELEPSSRALFPTGELPTRGGLLERVTHSGEPLLIEEFTLDHLAGVDPAFVEAVAQLDHRSMLIHPLTARGGTIGALIATTTRRSGRTLTPDLAGLVGTVSERAAQAIENARLVEELRGAESRFRAAFDHAPIGIALMRLDAQGKARYTTVNPAMSTIFGYEHDELVGEPAASFTHPEDREEEARRWAWLVGGDVGEVTSEKRHIRPDGEVRWVRVQAAPVEDEVFVAQYQDVTEQRRFQDQLEHLASHDALTGLFNRRRFEEDLEQTLALVRRHGDGAAVITLDIDNFKHVNDTYGHAIGDELLRACARALLDRTRLTDIVGRLGGDEFGVILLRAGGDEARAVARTLIEEIRRVSLSVGERTVRVTASAGLRALEPGEDRSAGELLGEADMAMYDAKERGRDRLSIIRSGDQQPERVRARMLWSERIRDALENEGGFVLFEQPILRLATGEVDRSELLIRMVGDSGEPIAPGHFLPVAERYGQMQAIDRWVVHSAIDLVAERRDAAAEMKVEVNLSGESMTDAAFVDYIIAEIRNARIDPRCLIFEVTETVAISNLDRARQLARRLSNLGCGFALDDFGAGFASFAYLKHLPLDVIKIDGEFIRHLPRSQHDQVTVRAIVDIARGLGKETVAEFVEDQETLEALKRLGVDRAQGYHVGRPRPASVHPAFQSL